ncbi:MAG: hypothetical protein HKN92_05280 [Chitinophagales bacterium]|nr:hypothetical protein [Chitinophagales bacterium]
MKYTSVIIIICTLLLFTQCSKETGCPGVKAYTERSKQGGKKGKGKAPWNKKQASSKGGSGLAPWTKKSKKKDNKKGSSSLYSKKVSKKAKQAEEE